MEIIKIAAFAFTALFLVILLKNEREDLAIQVSIAVGVIVFLYMLEKLTEVKNMLQLFSAKANMDIVYFNIIFKILGIAYISSFCSEICKDAGESNIASKVEFCGKILILILAIPILMAVLQSILKIM